MTITASPKDRLGGHVVLTITAPQHWVVLTHHDNDVKIDVMRLIEFAKRFGDDPDIYRYDSPHFSWIEEVTLREVGWIVRLSSGGWWPTQKLADAVKDWKQNRGM